jgi:hypothetical protein
VELGSRHGTRARSIVGTHGAARMLGKPADW